MRKQMEDQQTEIIRLRDRCPDTATKTNQDTAEVAVFPYGGRKYVDSHVTTTYMEIRALHQKLEA